VVDAGIERANPADVSSRSCPDWPALMELAPQLQFMHYTVGEVQLPPEAFVLIEGVSRDTVAVCCDLESHVYNPEHTDPRVVIALQGTHWIPLGEVSSSQG
jgi:hypothetical protein